MPTDTIQETGLNNEKLVKRIRYLLLLFIAGLIVSGVTAFPLTYEVRILHDIIGPNTSLGLQFPALEQWIAQVHEGIQWANRDYPFLFYGTDWLAFAHLVIALLFIGPYRDPVKNVWVIQFGMIACVLVIPLALICGPVRGIPFFWRLIDCSFGIVGIIPLVIIYQSIKKIVPLNGDETCD